MRVCDKNTFSMQLDCIDLVDGYSRVLPLTTNKMVFSL
jgi:hypothetical protein